MFLWKIPNPFVKTTSRTFLVICELKQKYFQAAFPLHFEKRMKHLWNFYFMIQVFDVLLQKIYRKFELPI